MPRKTQDILDHDDELAERFEDYEPDPDDERDPTSLEHLCDALHERSDAERSARGAVDRGTGST